MVGKAEAFVEVRASAITFFASSGMGLSMMFLATS